MTSCGVLLAYWVTSRLCLGNTRPLHYLPWTMQSLGSPASPRSTNRPASPQLQLSRPLQHLLLHLLHILPLSRHQSGQLPNSFHPHHLDLHQPRLLLLHPYHLLLHLDTKPLLLHLPSLHLLGAACLLYPRHLHLPRHQRLLLRLHPTPLHPLPHPASTSRLCAVLLNPLLSQTYLPWLLTS